ncbi:MAG: hypothetical protein HGA85_08610, partial [Nanoarchaeota archaeon]|nr:hypothetical protein [Nanoarchaeota archaeon]
IKKIPEKKLTKKGAHVFEYNKSFAHAKVYWNDKHELLISSYNLDIFERNFESAIYLRNKRIAGKLKEFFIQDEKVSSLKYNKKLA